MTRVAAVLLAAGMLAGAAARAADAPLAAPNEARIARIVVDGKYVAKGTCMQMKGMTEAEAKMKTKKS